MPTSAQGLHIGRDQPQILGDERQRAQLARNGGEKLGARAGHPFAASRAHGSRRDVPGGGKSPKMVEPDHVDIRQQRTEAIKAPPVARCSDGVPVINRISPELSQRAEIIGRYSGNEAWPVSLIELEQSGIGPHVARIPGNVERQVADEAQAFAVRIFLETTALPAEQELRKAHLGDRFSEFLLGRAESNTTALDQLCRPFEIIDALASRLERPEQRVVL